MKVIVTTSDNYHHCLPIFFEQYKKHWNDPFELVGYKQPNVWPPKNCDFVSLGIQRGPNYFSDDLRPYFQRQPQFFVWMMEDTFIKSFNRNGFNDLVKLLLYCSDEETMNYGRINLTTEGMKREYRISGNLYYSHPASNYRLSTQPSIWNRDFLLKYLTPGLSPWKFETQDTEDDYMVVGPVENVLTANEGVRKHDIYNLNLEGIE